MSTKALLVDYMGKGGNIKYGCYQALLDTWVRWTTIAMHLKKLYGQKVLIIETGGRFLTTGKNCLPQAVHKGF